MHTSGESCRAVTVTLTGRVAAKRRDDHPLGDRITRTEMVPPTTHNVGVRNSHGPHAHQPAPTAANATQVGQKVSALAIPPTDFSGTWRHS
jgi:hypothetical protein